MLSTTPDEAKTRQDEEERYKYNEGGLLNGSSVKNGTNGMNGH